jgi:hypothetical protein
MAPSHQRAPQRFDAVLPLRDAGFGRQPVLGEVDRASRSHHSPEFFSGSGTVQSVKVKSAASHDASRSGRSCPSRPMRDTRTGDAAIRPAAMRQATTAGSTARITSTSDG